MTQQLDDLKRLAEAATQKNMSDGKLMSVAANFHRAANPTAILSLIESYEQLQAKLDKACAALEKVKHNGCCMVCSESCPACNAHIALNEIRKKDE